MKNNRLLEVVVSLIAAAMFGHVLASRPSAALSVAGLRLGMSRAVATELFGPHDVLSSGDWLRFDRTSDTWTSVEFRGDEVTAIDGVTAKLEDVTLLAGVSSRDDVHRVLGRPDVVRSPPETIDAYFEIYHHVVPGTVLSIQYDFFTTLPTVIHFRWSVNGAR